LQPTDNTVFASILGALFKHLH